MIRTLKTVLSKEGRRINLLSKGKLLKNSPLIIGCFHGDEPQGEILINNYLNSVSNSNLLFIPCLNPDGIVKNTRQNANLVDLNRNFPTKNWILSEDEQYFGGNSAASEIETKFVIEILEEYNPCVVLSLHAPYRIVNFDGAALNLAKKISTIIEYPIQSDIGYPTPGSFGTYAGIERNIPTITLELDEKVDINSLTLPINKILNFLETYNPSKEIL